MDLVNLNGADQKGSNQKIIILATKVRVYRKPNVKFTEVRHDPIVTPTKVSKLVISIGNARVEITEDINLEFLQKVLKAVRAC